jgi:histidinol phosphatase-like PHP family hydrolase
MKKEFIYIAVIVALTLAGVVYKSMFLSGTIDDSRKALEEITELSAKYHRDSLVQENLKKTRKTFEINKRDSRNYPEVITDLLNVTENLLKEAKINYQGNDINPETDETKVHKNGKTSFFINLKYSANYEKIKKLISLIEENELIINIASLEIVRTKISPDERTKRILDDRGLEFDEFNSASEIKVWMRIEFVKFL